MKCFISRNGKVLGPYTEDEVHGYASSNDLIWMAVWRETGLQKMSGLVKKTT